MIKTILIIFSIFLFNSSFANDTLTIVAIGDAESEADLIGIKTEGTELLTKKEKKKYNKVLDIIIADFGFYKNLFEVKTNILEDTKLRYLLSIKVTSNKKGVFLLEDKLNKNVIYKKEITLRFSNIRSFAHDISNDIYESITGKASIFKTKIFFVSSRGSRKSSLKKELYIMDFDGARKQRLTFQNSIVISPSVSHDNKKVLFTLIESQFKKSSRGKIQKIKNLNLYEMSLRNRKMKLISNVKGINSGAVYTKDGKSIYLTLSYQKNADIYKMNLKTRKKTQITSHFSDDVDPHINGDESLMTILSGRPGKAMIYTLDPKGKEKSVKRISYVGRFNASPRFNKEGSEIVFSSWVDNRFDIYRINSDGKNLVRLTKNFGSNEEPWFSPDGEFIVFTSQRVISRKKAVQDMYIMNREGEVIKKISENFGHISTPRWSN
jgi:TolB protein